MELKRREGESISSFLHRFTKKVRQNGIILEAKKRRFRRRPVSRRARRASAIFREGKRKEVERARKLGLS